MRPETELAPHTLLRIAPRTGLICDGTVPGWVPAALSRAPWVVVRRAAARDGLIPVGVRGTLRAERLAAWLDPRGLLERLRPTELLARRGSLGAARCASIAALAALGPAAALMRAHQLAWGPCGSVGFELASGVATATADSDLDLMVELPEPLPAAAAAALLAACGALGVRVDVQLEGPYGAVALAEYAAGRAPLVLRTLDGPRLVRDPWTPTPAAA